MKPWAIRAAAVVVVAGGLLVLLDYIAPLQWPTVLVYTGITILLVGLICILKPLRFLGVNRRSHGLFAVAAGCALLAAGLVWPVTAITRTARQTELDEFLPEYDFHESHSTRVHATPARVMHAAWKITFADISAFRTLGRIRSIALGDFRSRPVRTDQRPILELMSSAPGSGFFPLAITDRECLFGMAGRPWANDAERWLTPEQFRAWRRPDAVRIAFNFVVEDEGGGWSRLSTETRVQATDDASRRTMARYWRLIYPGSGLLRRAMLSSIRERAESGR
jgi:hypothetical protein